jgi:hypothetical protein
MVSLAVALPAASPDSIGAPPPASGPKSGPKSPDQVLPISTATTEVAASAGSSQSRVTVFDVHSMGAGGAGSSAANSTGDGKSVVTVAIQCAT